MKTKKINEITVYDNNDTSFYIDPKKRMTLQDIGIELPKDKPTKVVSLRLSSDLINKIKAYASQQDVPYSTMIKILLNEGINKKYKGLQ
jgi:predicted DNA binding CopG/RHH family protein